MQTRTKGHDKQKATEPVGFRLTQEQFSKLKQLAEKDRRRIGELCRIVIEDYIERTAA